MKAQDQLKETLKLLTHSYVDSVQKMTALHQKHLLIPKQELFCKILQMIEFHNGLSLVEDYVKMLENNYEDTMKNECFQKDLSFSIQNNSDQKNSCPSEQNLEEHHQKDSFEDEQINHKKAMENFERSNEITKYNTEGLSIFKSAEMEEDECKRQEPTPINKHQIPNQEIINYQSSQYSSSQIIKLKREQEKQEDSEQQDQESSSDSDDSSFKYEDSVENSQQNNNESEAESNSNNQNQTLTYLSQKYKCKKKKYRSYTEQQRVQAVNYAKQMGVQFVSRVLNIPKKNISRWMTKKTGPQRSRGRKPGDPYMEQALNDWVNACINNGIYVTQTEIRKKAREFSEDKKFKASKGWLEKYFRRNQEINKQLYHLLTIKRMSLKKFQTDKMDKIR